MNTTISRRNVALAIIVLLGIYLGFALKPYLVSFLGAVVIYVLFRPVYGFLISKFHISEKLSALIIIFFSFFLLTVPIFLSYNTAVSEINNIINSNYFDLETSENFKTLFDNFNFFDEINEVVSDVVNLVKDVAFKTIQGFMSLIINWTIMYFVVYYLFVKEAYIKDKIFELIPFNKKNTGVLVEEMRIVTNSTVISTGLVALVKSILFIITLSFFSIESLMVLGFISFILAFLPVVGIPVLSVPIAVLQYVNGNVFAALVILIVGFILANLDNFLKPFFQKKVGKIHPLITLVGTFFGISSFGFIGIVIGPLILTYFILMVRMFKEEFFTAQDYN